MGIQYSECLCKQMSRKISMNGAKGDHFFLKCLIPWDGNTVFRVLMQTNEQKISMNGAKGDNFFLKCLIPWGGNTVFRVLMQTNEQKNINEWCERWSFFSEMFNSMRWEYSIQSAYANKWAEKYQWMVRKVIIFFWNV